MNPEILVIDVEGVLTDGTFTYTAEGKAAKVFGPDDQEALKLLAPHLELRFVSSDDKGFVISKRRISQDMGYQLDLVPVEDRIRWITEQFDASKVIYIADGIFDAAIFDRVGYSICPADGFPETRERADFVTQCSGGHRAVAEACVHILERWFDGATRPLTPSGSTVGAGA